ncbi:hypothetical protein CP97_06430 [Aurantiacibacter atlanticus]|uniref:DUF3617 family protein n=1 Tax=Aurantiacibacter atlanticus TaxID=1648404 RepID=A0A0H4VF93_9SPHN|nr:DUF3617 family protein [Aurantiacibacter atlanticus]AKQ41734.1 hypothetical protein CP97_06430 [Aurantiacibacter atlanticus]MDF1833809.1 DUF3617 family protein [Alteraurantiacibacter sp. bin_em_oilr2.035]
MRPIHALPLIAALALAACNNDDDEALTDEDLAGSTIQDNGAMPQPGEYATTVELIDFVDPDLDQATMARARSEFEIGAAEPSLYCVTEETTREVWLSDMTEATCTLSRFTADGNSLDGAMTCSSDIGLNGPLEMTGTAGGQSADLRMSYTMPEDAGAGTVTMRVLSERIGDCS